MNTDNEQVIRTSNGTQVARDTDSEEEVARQRSGSAMVKIPHPNLNLSCLIDLEDLGRLSMLPWGLAKCGRDRDKVYVRARINGRLIGMAHFILGVPANVCIDHKNGNTLDNRKCNLRRANARQNARNQAKKQKSRSSAGPSSRFKGVHLDRSTGSWRAQIRDGSGKQVSIGSFQDELNAALAYDARARVLHGEFARCNFEEPNA